MNQIMNQIIMPISDVLTNRQTRHLPRVANLRGRQIFKTEHFHTIEINLLI